MALIICPECGKDISDQSEVCVHCGYPIRRAKDPDRQPGYAVVCLGADNRGEAIQTLTELGLASSQAEAVVERAPSVIARDLCYPEAETWCKKLMGSGVRYRMLKNEDLEYPDRWELTTPPPEVSAPAAKKEPMSFGMTVCAVILGIVAAILLLCFL